MKYYAMSLEEIAKELGTTEPAVRAIIRKALFKLRLRYPEHYSWLTGESYAHKRMVASHRRGSQAGYKPSAYGRCNGERWRVGDSING